jgi:hypothetical protein
VGLYHRFSICFVETIKMTSFRASPPQADESRNLRGIALLNQISPLRDASHRFGRNDTMVFSTEHFQFAMAKNLDYKVDW